MKKENQTIIAFVEFCEKLGIKPCDARSVACYYNFTKATKKVVCNA